jgi:hypothetical protein
MLRAIPIRPRPAVAGKCSPGKPQALEGRAGLTGAPALLFALIHPSAWNRNSANFAITEFSEDEMRRPTPYAVPLGLQTFDGL